MSTQAVSRLNSLSSSEISMVQSLQAIYDEDTNKHAQRVMVLAGAIANELQLAEDEIFLVCLSALLHDIGKASIPDAILNKPGPLNEQEQRIMRCHSEIGQMMILQAGDVFIPVASVVLSHHERWDGEGYPNKISGEAIPLAARIIAVADTYDVMVQRRAYHEPQTAPEACVELQRCAGSQFDPHIVAIFLSSLLASKELQEESMHIRAVGEVEWVDAMYAKPSPQSGEYAHALV